jgi:hypothetical protein
MGQTAINCTDRRQASPADTISSLAIESFTGTLLLPNAALINCWLHCIAARRSGELFCQRSSRRLPSLLNRRSHSQLEPEIDTMSIASLCKGLTLRVVARNDFR